MWWFRLDVVLLRGSEKGDADGERKGSEGRWLVC
jgi:hypothetical protein